MYILTEQVGRMMHLEIDLPATKIPFFFLPFFGRASNI